VGSIPASRTRQKARNLKKLRAFYLSVQEGGDLSGHVCQLADSTKSPGKAHNARVRVEKHLHKSGDRSVSRATSVLLQFVVLSGPPSLLFYVF